MKLPKLSLVPQFDRSPRWVAFAQTIQGRLVLVAVFAGLLFLHETFLWWLISLYLLIFSLLPKYRWQILLAATWSFLMVGPTDFHWERVNALLRGAGSNWQIGHTGEGLPLILTAILFAVLCIWLTLRYRKLMRRPILALVCLYLGLMISASYAPMPQLLRAMLWAFLVVFGKYFWFTCYSLKECLAPKPQPLYLQFGQYLPFWYPASIPYPKGSGYLKKIEAKDDVQFAVCRLKGLKLLIWALWLKAFSVLINFILFGYSEVLFGRIQFKREAGAINLFFDGNFLQGLANLPLPGLLPQYETAFNLAVIGNPLPWHMNWIVLVVSFLDFLLYVAFATHVIIAIIRMCGFNALRNTYRPLASRSIAEFWNRYFYYFKELLVEFFFYPTFFRYFKRHPRLRMYMATMAAAFFGNFLYHLMRDIWFVVELGFFQALIAFHSYFVYSFILGNVIFLSQWRQENLDHRKPGLLSRFFAPVRVFGFYCLLSIFVDFRRADISDNIAFLLSLSPF